MFKKEGFTLVEVLIVIGIVAVISVTVILALNPQEILRQARDSNRLAEMSELNKAINLFLVERSTASLGTSNTIYVSAPDPALSGNATSTCPNMGLSAPPGWNYQCASSANVRNVNGTGWMPVNFALLSKAPLSKLPTDPTNNPASGLYYAFVPNGNNYTLVAAMESQKRLQSSARNDGGSDPARVEFGVSSLWAQANALKGYWKFDEGALTNNCTTNTVADSSQNSNHGKSCTMTSVYPTIVAGKVGNAINFIGNTASGPDYVFVNDSATLFSGATTTIMAWIKPTNINRHTIFSDYRSGVEYGLETLTDGRTVRFFSNNAGGEVSSDLLGPVGSIPSNGTTWAHLVVTWGGGQVRTYINGSLAAGPLAFNYNPIARSSFEYNIGRRAGSAFPMSGAIDELRVYGKALSAQEVQLLWNATK